MDKKRKEEINNINYQIKPFIRWAGGKQNLVNKLLPLFPKSNISNYFEPFLGAGSMFFATSYPGAFLSDVNGHLINSFIAVRDNPSSVFEGLIYLRNKLDKEYYYQIRKEFNSNLKVFDIQQAIRFIFLIHTSFNGIYRVNQKGEYNVPVGKLKPAIPTFEHLRVISRKLQNVSLFNYSFEKIFELVSKNDFVYLDPPYPPLSNTSSFQHYTIDKFSDVEQGKVAAFANILSEKGAKVLISNADLPQIKALYLGWSMTELETIRFVSCKSTRMKIKELAIKNY